MKNFLKYLLALIILGIGSFYLLYQWLEKSYLPHVMQDVRILGEPLTLAQAPKLHLFPLSIELTGVNWHGVISSHEASLGVHKIWVIPDLPSLLAGPLKIQDLEWHEPELRLEAKSDEPQDRPGVSGQTSRLEIDRFTINGGQVFYQTSDQNITLTNVRADARNIYPRQDTYLQCDFGAAIRDRSLPGDIVGNFAGKLTLRYYAPNLSFRDAALTFTITSLPLSSKLTPCQAILSGAFNLQSGQIRISKGAITTPLGGCQFQGTSELGQKRFAGRLKLERQGNQPPNSPDPGLESAFIVDRTGIRFSGATLYWHNIQLGVDLAVNLDNPRKLAEYSGEIAGGTVAGALRWDGDGFLLESRGEHISLGEILTQAGLPGLNGGDTKFQLSMRFKGTDALAMRQSITGTGSWVTENLELEPFGEMGLLLPLLGGVSQAVPRRIDKLILALTGKDGSLSFKPITATGPNFSGTGSASWQLATNEISGTIVLRTPGLKLPLAFGGKPGNLEVSIDPELLHAAP